MSDLGVCSRCDERAVVVVNGRGACRNHIDVVMARAFAGIAKWWRKP